MLYQITLGKKNCYSDYNSLIGYLDLKFRKVKIERKTMFNYRNGESMNMFKNFTKKTIKHY